MSSYENQYCDSVLINQDPVENLNWPEYCSKAFEPKKLTNNYFPSQGWRVCYYGAGGLALIIAVLTGTTLKEPERKTIGEENQADPNAKEVTIWSLMKEPRIIMLVIAASIRHSGGMTFAYNADLYYNIYFPDVDLGWWLFGVTIGIGSVRQTEILFSMSDFNLNLITDWCRNWWSRL